MRKNVFPITAGVFGSLALAVSASADFTGVTIEEALGLGTPAGFVTYRVVAHFDGPNDIFAAWGAIPEVGPLVFYTGGGDPGFGVDLLNAGGGFTGLKFEDFAGFPVALAYDSYLTVGATVLAGNNTDYSPGFIGSDGVFAAVVGNAFGELDGLVFNADPTTPVIGADLVLAQFTIPGFFGGQPGDEGHFGFHLEGILGWVPPPPKGEPPVEVIETFMVDNIPAPGTLALLGLAGLAGARRRRRRG